MTQVAVYGSLRQGFGNHRLLAEAKYVGTTQTKKPFSMYSLGGFPMVQLHGEQVTPITVEVYDCNEETLRRLDCLEGYRGEGMHNFYDRDEVETGLGTCLIYHIEGSDRKAPLVESGDWKQFCESRSARY